MNDEGRCRSCGAWPRLLVDEDGKPESIEWRHGDSCSRTVAEEKRLRGLAERPGSNPLGVMFTPFTPPS